MRERTLKVDKEKLKLLSMLHRPKKVADRLGISKQRWHNYTSGENDIPESMIDAICSEFSLDKNEIVVS